METKKVETKRGKYKRDRFLVKLALKNITVFLSVAFILLTIINLFGLTGIKYIAVFCIVFLAIIGL